ncbi:MAG TPA: TonB-dependent receptor plug domain-containing protein [Vicinamibacterales bacterium]|nr:TonB-dependent receptor plug domain-containing protein [Vicinamibacterales bacterium]
MKAVRAVSVVVCAAMFLIARPVWAQAQGSLVGTVVDSLGARVSGAGVALSGPGVKTVNVQTESDGSFSFTSLVPGRYQVTATAQGFSPRTSDPVYVGAGARAIVVVALEVGPLQQEIVVTAEPGGVLQARTGAPVTVIDNSTLDALNKPDLLEALRLVPGSQIVQVGQRGGLTSMFLRGGNSNFTKVLIDGVPANDIGGAFDFSQLDTAGVDRIEVLRQTNSVVYGSDALTGVVNITTRRGSTRTPELEYAIDGGNLNTVRNSLGFGGAIRRIDYFSQYSYFTTDNSTPNSGYHRGTYAGRFGVVVGGGTHLTGTLRRVDGTFGNANAFDSYLVPDDSTQDADLTYGSITADSQHSNRWQSSIRFGSIDQRSLYVNPTPSGEPYDPFGFGANYLGNTVTLMGANGETVTGRAILDYGFSPFPQSSDSRVTRRTLSGQTTFQVASSLAISGGARYEREQGFDDPDGDPVVTRNNGGAFVEARVNGGGRAYVSGGVGVEHNEVFGTEATPRVSVAVYLRNPRPAGVGETKLTVNAGKGIKAPNVFQEQNALYALVQDTPAAARVSPVGPERSRGFDVGVEQGLAGGRVRARVSYFNNEFDDLLEYLGRTALVLAGVPPDVAAGATFAYINSQSYRAQGAEISADAAVGTMLRFGASYTYLDAEVTQAFSASAAFNPAFPNVPIGAFSPLVGARPFRRPANSGTLLVTYVKGPGQVTLAGYFSGKRDDSTFLSDQDFGNSLLLPNKDLDPAYQKIDLSAAYRVHPRLNVYTSIENLFDQKFDAAFGFPSLPFTIRAGVRVDVGGDR